MDLKKCVKCDSDKIKFSQKCDHHLCDIHLNEIYKFNTHIKVKCNVTECQEFLRSGDYKDKTREDALYEKDMEKRKEDLKIEVPPILC